MEAVNTSLDVLRLGAGLASRPFKNSLLATETAMETRYESTLRIGVIGILFVRFREDETDSFIPCCQVLPAQVVDVLFSKEMILKLVDMMR